MDGLHKYVLFYSTNCQYSVKLLSVIENNGLENSFTKVNIDFTDDIPSFVTVVPTVLVNKQSKIAGQAVFEWIQKLTEKSSLQPMSCDQISDPYSFISGDEQNIHQSYSLLDCDYGGGPSAGKGQSAQSAQSAQLTQPTQAPSRNGGGNGDDMMQRIMDSRSNEVPAMVRRV